MAKWYHDDLCDKTPLMAFPMAWYCAACGQHHPTKEHDCPALLPKTTVLPPAQIEATVKARGSDLMPQTPSSVRTFGTGATRDIDANKFDFEGFLSPLVLERYAEHMHKARKMPDGSMRASDNWQLGIPRDAYMKSMFRHFFAVWKSHRGLGDETDIETELTALLFNVNGYLHETLKAKRDK